MSRILCLLGIHKWRPWKRRLVYWDQRSDVYQVFQYCERCRRERQFYDDGSEAGSTA